MTLLISKNNVLRFDADSEAMYSSMIYLIFSDSMTYSVSVVCSHHFQTLIVYLS